MTAPCPSIHLRASCHCGLFNTTFSLPLTSFPLKSALCHCTSCRHATGQLFATFAVIPLPLLTDATGFDKLTRYDSSGTLSRYFCPTCGASILNVEAEEWEFATGVLEFLGDGGANGHEMLAGGLLDRALLFVGGTVDGGAVPWINGGKAEGLVGRKMGGRMSQDVTDGMLVGMEQYSKQISKHRGEKLEGRCHCGELKFEIWPPEGKEERYAANLCACTSCRKVCGFEITSWASVPRAKVRMSDGKALEAGCKDMGFYSTSENVERNFCKRCGATFSYGRQGADTIDIAFGLLDAPEGSRADHWFEWNQEGDDLAYQADAVDQAFAKRLAEGVRQKTRHAT